MIHSKSWLDLPSPPATTTFTLIMISIRDHDAVIYWKEFNSNVYSRPVLSKPLDGNKMSKNISSYYPRDYPFVPLRLVYFSVGLFGKENSSELLIDEATNFSVDNKILNTKIPHFVSFQGKIARKINFCDDGSETGGGLLINDESF